MTDWMRGAREEASEMDPRVRSPEPLELRSRCRNGTGTCLVRQPVTRAQGVTCLQQGRQGGDRRGLPLNF